MTTFTEIEITARAKAFTGQGVQSHRFLVDADDVRVWDRVAGHFTRVNCLTDAAKRRIRKQAEAQARDAE